MNALVTDLYQLTMAAGYWEAGKAREHATFELFVRRLPKYRNFVLAAGLQQAVEYLLALRFTSDEIAYLRGLPQFHNVHSSFFDMLAEFRFTGDVFAVREGTPLFAGEPFLTIRAPIIEAQLPETYLLATIGFQSMIATKAARVVKAATGRTVVEFGTRRAHSPEAGVLAGRAAYLAGCIGTSNVATGYRYGVPIFGTAAHSWVLSFATEYEAHARLQALLGDATAYLIDTYDTLEGARQAASLGRPIWGVRLDSGNFVELAPAVRKILDDAGLQDAQIMATGDLNEYKIHELVAAGVPIDSFGVGTDLATSADSPSLGVIYKMVELEGESGHRFTAKFSDEKTTWPGSKQVFRYAGRDLIGRSCECPDCKEGSEPCEALLRPVILGGQLIEPLPTLDESRAYAAKALASLPAPCLSLFDHEDPYRVEYSKDLMALAETVRRGLARVSVGPRTSE
ncbi:MAG: nicotinate phosphoribosyltransferase [Bryobacteraceae bacterium]